MTTSLGLGGRGGEQIPHTFCSVTHRMTHTAHSETPRKDTCTAIRPPSVRIQRGARTVCAHADTHTLTPACMCHEAHSASKMYMCTETWVYHHLVTPKEGAHTSTYHPRHTDTQSTHTRRPAFVLVLQDTNTLTCTHTHIHRPARTTMPVCTETCVHAWHATLYTQGFTHTCAVCWWKIWFESCLFSRSHWPHPAGTPLTLPTSHSYFSIFIDLFALYLKEQ